MMLKHLLYSIVVLILGIFIIQHIQINGSFFSIIEGARTYPMPRRHPLTYTYGTVNNESSSNIVSMNTIIDQNIDTFFDQKKVPYMNTIDLVVNFIVGENPYQYGTISEDLKSKLTDIGYYFLEIVIPMLPTQTNTKPTIHFPPLKWSGLPPFNVEIANVPSYLIYKGSSENNFNNIYNNANLNTYFQSNPDSSDTTEQTSSIASSSDKCGSGEDSNNCGIQCPETCFLSALGSVAPASAPASVSAPATSLLNENDKSTYRQGIFNGFSINGANKYTNKNIATIGTSTYTGYDITQIKLEQDTLNNTILTDKIEQIIYTYFTKEGSKTGEPTAQFMELFKYYYQQFSPMDMYHQEKLRNLVYYVLQTIIPGIPTPAVPHLYIQWQPFGKYTINP